MPQLIHTRWVSGNLVFYDDSRNIIATWDSANRQILVPSGSAITVASGGTLTVAGTAITASTLALNGLTATASELNESCAASGLSTDGLTRMGIARFTFDATGTAGNRTVAAHAIAAATLPINAVIVGGFFDVNTAFTSGTSTATVAISVVGANDIFTATAVSDAKLGTIGLKAIVPKSNTPEQTGIKVTSALPVTCTVAVEALTGGKLTGFLYYVVSAVSA